MKRHQMIIYILLTLGILVIIISIYVAKQGLRKISQTEGKLQVQDVSRQVPKPPIITEQREELVGTKKQEAKPQELEFDLDKIPDDYVNKDIESERSAEELTSGERKLNIQPSSRELKELKIKRVIIY